MTPKEVRLLDYMQVHDFMAKFEAAVVDFKTYKIDHQELLEILSEGLEKIETQTIEVTKEAPLLKLDESLKELIKEADRVVLDKLEALDKEVKRLQNELLKQKLSSPIWPHKEPAYPYTTEPKYPSDPFIVMRKMGGQKLEWETISYE